MYNNIINGALYTHEYNNNIVKPRKRKSHFPWLQNDDAIIYNKRKNTKVCILNFYIFFFCHEPAIIKQMNLFWFFFPNILNSFLILFTY